MLLHSSIKVCFSFLGFCYALYRFFELNDHEVFSLPDERGHTGIKTSFLEYLFVNEVYREYGFPETFSSQVTHSRTIRFGGKYVPDYVLYDPNDPEKVLEIG